MITHSGAPPPELEENVIAWKEKTRTNVGSAKKMLLEIQQAVVTLEQNEALKIETQAKEKKRQEAIAAAKLERKRKEEARLKEEEKRRQLMEDQRKHKAALKHAKLEEAEALKVATAAFKSTGEQEQKAQAKSRRTIAARDISCKLLGAILECQHGCSKKFGDLKVCKKRMAVRETRPHEESFEDRVDIALAKELQTLTGGREMLWALCEECEQVKEQIDRTRHLLVTDTSRTKVVERLQNSSSLPTLQLQRPSTANLRMKKAASASKLERPITPTLAINESSSNAEIMQVSAPLLRRALDLVMSVNAAVAKSDDECTKATSATTAALDRRKAETLTLIESLRAQIAEVKNTIWLSERKLVGLRRRSRHIDKTEDDAAATNKQVMDAEDMIFDLKELQQTLEEDLRKKNAAFKIDEWCRILTKSRAAGE